MDSRDASASKNVLKSDVGVFNFLRLGLWESILKEVLLTKKI